MELISIRDLRDGINQHIGHTWFENNKTQRKKSLLELIKSDKDFFFVVLKTLQESSLEHYDVEHDYQGLRRWLEDSKKFITPQTFNKIKSVNEKQEDLFAAVEEIIAHFKDLIEQQGLWSIFWTKHGSSLKHVKELYSQMLFYMVSNIWLMSQDSNVRVDRCFNKEAKQIHYIFSVSKKCSVTVQVKHADNFAGLEKGYNKQHDLYDHGEVKRSLYLVINFEDKQSNQLLAILENHRGNCKILVINASAQEDQQSNNDEFAWFDDLESEENRYTAEKSKGGKKRHEQTEIIKDKIIRPMFAKKELIKGITTKQRAKKINDILSKLQQMNENQLFNLANKFEVDIGTLKNSAKYFSDDKEEQIYKWCLAIDKKEA